jgi:hypothetical protein
VADWASDWNRFEGATPASKVEIGELGTQQSQASRKGNTMIDEESG